MITALTLLGAARAHEGAGHDPDPHPAGGDEEPTAMLAGRATGGLVLEHGHSEALAGGGLAAERVLARGWGLEGTVGLLLGHHVAEVPVELVLERSVEVERLEPYVGAGPALVVATHPGAASDLRIGGVGVVGIRRWFSERWGVLVELDLTASYREGWALGGEAITGVGIRWD